MRSRLPRHAAYGCFNSFVFAALVLAAACGGPLEGSTDPHPLDLVAPAEGKADGSSASFVADHLVSDDAFFDGDAVDAATLQTFLEQTIYGTRSFLADYVFADGRSFATVLHDTAHDAHVNPLVLLVTLQKESSLVSRTKPPSKSSLDYALGCGCPDSSGCDRDFRGLDRQLACAAELLRKAKTALDAGEPTISGRRPGNKMTTSDGKTLWLANKATTILYTYTPWVLEKKGGNWLFWNIWRRYAEAVGYTAGLTFPFNEGFIGGACASDGDCFFEGASCRLGASGLGQCTVACDRYCPDRDARHYVPTFCIADDAATSHATKTGRCAATCSGSESAESNTCPGQERCVLRERNEMPDVKRQVCTND